MNEIKLTDIPDNIKLQDLKFLEQLKINVNQKNINTFSFIKSMNAANENENYLYGVLLMSGHSDKKDKNYSELGEKLCGIFLDGTHGNKTENKKFREVFINYLRKQENEKNKKEEVLRAKMLSEHKHKMETDPAYRKKFNENLIKNTAVSEEMLKLITIKQTLENNLKDFAKKIDNTTVPLWLQKVSLNRRLEYGITDNQKNNIYQMVAEQAQTYSRSNSNTRSFSRSR